MNTKAKQLLYPVGIESLFIAFWENQEESRDELPKFEEEIYRLDNIVTLGIAGNPSDVVKWASNKIFVSASRNTQYDLNLTHVALPQEIKDKMDGIVSVKGVAFDTSETKEHPYFAMGFIAPLSDGSRVARWYPKVQKTLSEETFQTVEEEQEIQDLENVFRATSLLHNNVTVADFSEVRDSALGITAEQFMKQVIADESQLDLLIVGNGNSGGTED